MTKRKLWLAVSFHFFFVGLVLLAPPSPAFARGNIEVEAIAGRPFGVAIITLPPNAETMAAVETNNFAIVERNGRALYPAFTPGRVRRLLGELLGADLGNMPASLSVAFLFTGDEPLQLTLYAPQPLELQVVPRPPTDRQFDRLLSQWWKDYSAAARQQLSEGDYPPIVQTYLTSMLSRRLRLEPPLLTQLAEPKPDELQQNLELLLGVERLQAATMKETMAGGPALTGVADLPLPREIQWGPRLEPPFDPQAVIEPIAQHVPEDCFYIRFGKFSNYVWLSKLMDEYGGDIGSMVTLRGLKSDGDQRNQRQLALKESAIGDLFGDAVISDVALIGRDLFLEEGAAIGMLFEARTSLLGSSFNSERKGILAEEKQNGATLETIKIADRDVSFLSTPDNQIRSFYAVDGNYHLFTTSRAMVEQFYAIGTKQAALGATAEFKHARTEMPTSRDDTIFVYFSSAFFRGLASPQYQIELGRRIQSLTDLQLVQLARLAAKAEGRANETLEDLVAANVLPPGFGRRPDGSGPIMTEKRMLDSLRGSLGTFLPVPDVTIKSVTRAEAEAAARRAAFYESQWKQMDPLMVGVKRFALDTKQGDVANGKVPERIERIVIDGNVSPLDDGKYGKLASVLGPPNRERISPDPNDIISVQAHLKGGLMSPSVPPHHLFLGIQDSIPAMDPRASGLLKTLKILQTTPGYLGAWPKPGFVDMLPLGLGGSRPDPWGYSQLLFGLWRRQWGGFSAFSFDRRVLDNVTPTLRPELTDTDAQIRIHVGDLARSQLSVWVNALYFERAKQASVGNVRFVHAISQQLQVPREDARRVAENLLDAQLVCTLGGEYEYIVGRGDLGEWRSTKCPPPGNDRIPPEFRAPILDWFRGLDASLIKLPDSMLVHAQLDMQRKANEPKIELPFFNLFGGDKKVEKKPEPKPAVPEKNLLPAPAKDPSKIREF